MSFTIGIDATYSVGSALSGVGRYSVRLLEELCRGWPQVQWRQYYRPHRFLRAPWPKRLLFETAPRSCDLFHGLNQRLPKRSQIPCVATFHDLFVMSAEYSSPEFRLRFEEQARHAAEQASRIIAVSHFTAGQVESLLGFPAERIRVVPHGVDPPKQTKPIEGRKPVVLSVGAVQKRKNTKRLVQAFAELPPPWELWIAGSLGYEAEAMLAEARGNSRVRLLGYVSDAELERMYGEASVLAFPSLDEGFGIPVLEGMAHGLAVLTSKTSAMPEVAGEAALLVDPYEVEAIAAGLLRLTDAGERARYAQAGLERVKEFSWGRAARETVAVYEEVLGRFA